MFKKILKSNNKKQQQKDDMSNISINKVEITIFRLMSNRTPSEIKTFVAEQKEENDMILLINEDENFKEDVSFSKHKKIRELEYQLELQNQTSEKEKINIVDTSLNTWLSKLSELSTQKKEDTKDNQENIIEVENQKYNKLDIENKIRYLKVLRYKILNQGEGTHETITKTGMRKIFFAEIDGARYPYFFTAPTSQGDLVSCYPDIALKKPIYTKSITRALADYNEETTDRANAILENVKSIANILFFIASIILFVIAYNNAIELPEKYGDRCVGYAYATSEVINNVAQTQGELIDYALKHKANESLIPKTTDAPIKPESKIINMVTGN